MTRKRLLKPWFRKLRFDRFAADERGVAAVEFAAVLPVVLILLLGCFEVPRFVLTYQKLARTAHSVADLVSQADEPMTLPQLQDVFVAAKMIMAPYDIIGAGKVFVSSINNPSGTVSITWQKSNDSTLTSLKSRIGTVGGGRSVLQLQARDRHAHLQGLATLLGLVFPAAQQEPDDRAEVTFAKVIALAPPG
jgi:Flp pilus assembly protein TadG